MTTKLTPGNVPLSDQLGFCACMGPMYGEPECYCSMVRLGIPLNESARTESEARLTAALDKVFGWSVAPSDEIETLERLR